ncbi:iron-containing redox enzyme family protein [Variovorax sp. GT1P44]|uniref:iron-containing redox enzyme family protein n=1 Tax=Variovorax sp. GT1P44 TaxID=3443742 RepID=UPI003F47261E
MISIFQGFVPPHRLMPSGSAANCGATSECAGRTDALPTVPGTRDLYDRLMHPVGLVDPGSRKAARDFLDVRLQSAAAFHCDLPENTEGLEAWVTAGVARTGRLYQDYLARRNQGGPREYFRNRSHALGVLRTIAPTKLVDGAWLYGMLWRAGDASSGELVQTYLEELGDGVADKNHVLLYRRLLHAHGIDDWHSQQDACFEQGAIQLALAACSDELLPEVMGFNLGYEQLPLHLLITAYELNELGVDPYYFTLHVTVDNAAGGHAIRAVRAVRDATAAAADPESFWRRVRRGFQLNELGVGTNSAIASFDPHAEFLRVLAQRTVEGQFAHSNYCRIEGRTVNDWLAAPDGIQGFVEALERKGWLSRNVDPGTTRFWQLLQGERAEMFGVFGSYERQVIYDWIRGTASSDGASAPASTAVDAVPHPPRSFRHQQRAASAVEAGLGERIQLESMAADAELAALTERLASTPDAGVRLNTLREMMGPSRHWTPSGLHATRLFRRAVLGVDAL